jgi:hypothetical protein
MRSSLVGGDAIASLGRCGAGLKGGALVLGKIFSCDIKRYILSLFHFGTTVLPSFPSTQEVDKFKLVKTTLISNWSWYLEALTIPDVIN